MTADRQVFVMFAAGLMSAGLLGCTIENVGTPEAGSGGADPATASGEVSRIQIDGSSTVKMITAAISEEFEHRFSDVKIALKVTGTGTGFKEMIAGRIDVANASRPIKESEKSDCAKNGIELLELTVALDGLTVCVNHDNDWVDSVTVAQLKHIWEPGSSVRTWRDVDTSWPDIPIALYGPGEESGTFDFFTEAINGKEDAIREDYSPSADDNVTVTGISGEKGGMGFFGCAYYFANQDKVRALKVSPTDSVADAVEPTPETVKAGEYKPLARPLFIYVKKSSLARQEVRDFVRFYLNEGQKQVSAIGYVDISEQQLKASRDAFATAIR
jgi:phosphate transport system substrate-binding protein